MIPYHINGVFGWGWFKFRPYGFLAAIGILIGLYLAVKLAQKQKIAPKIILSLSAVVLVGGLLGARLLYYLVWSCGSFWDFFNPFKGGVAWQGCLIGAILASCFYFYRKKLDFWKYADIFAPSVAIGLFFGRIGCFLGGCCHGLPTAVPWAIIRDGVAIHPTQIYSSLNALMIFGVLSFLNMKKRFNGFIFLLFLMIYSVTRFIIEFFRYEEIYYFSLTPSQWVSIGMFIPAGILMIYLWRKK